MRHKKRRGFSLFELVLAMALLSIISGAAFLGLNQSQKVYVSDTTLSTMYSTVRSAAELLSQEIGQAGLVCGTYSGASSTNAPCVGTSLAGSVTSGATSATLNSTSGIYNGEKLMILDAANGTETVTVSAVTSSTTITLSSGFSNSHPASTPVTATGVFPQGVVGTTTGNTYTTRLQLLGDINGDGTLVFVEYNCDFTAGTMTRSSTPLTFSTGGNLTSTKNAADVLVDNLFFSAPLNSPPGWNGTTPYCFSINTTSVTVNGTAYYFVTQVGLLISTQSPAVDPQTHKKWQLTKSFLNLSPRNVVAGLDLASNGVMGAIQQTPSGVPLP